MSVAALNACVTDQKPVYSRLDQGALGCPTPPYPTPKPGKALPGEPLPDPLKAPGSTHKTAERQTPSSSYTAAEGSNSFHSALRVVSLHDAWGWVSRVRKGVSPTRSFPPPCLPPLPSFLGPPDPSCSLPACYPVHLTHPLSQLLWMDRHALRFFPIFLPNPCNSAALPECTPTHTAAPNVPAMLHTPWPRSRPWLSASSTTLATEHGWPPCPTPHPRVWPCTPRSPTSPAPTV